MEIGQKIYGAYGGYLGLTEDKNSSKNAKIGLKITLLSKILGLLAPKGGVHGPIDLVNAIGLSLGMKF